MAKSKIRGRVLQITEPRVENNKSRKKYHEINYQYENKNQIIQNGRQQNIPRASWVQQRYNIPQYQIPSPQRPNPYPAFQNIPQPGFSQGFQSRFRNNQYRYQYNPYNQIIPRMNQLAIDTVPGQITPTIAFLTETWENPRENGQKNFQKQFASNENRNQRRGNWNNKLQDNLNWSKQGAQSQNGSAKENLIHLNCYNCKKPGHFKREYQKFVSIRG